jgi:hypothetical protein
MNTASCGPTTYEARHWPINWSAVFAGSLAALAIAVIAGLASVAVGAQMVGHGESVTSWHRVQVGGLIWAVCSAFFSFVAGGWVAGKITGHTICEHSMLHAALAWCVSIPFFILITALGAGSYLGGWYGGLAGTPAWVVTNPSTIPAADAYAIVRNNALGALSALVLGLIGSVLGGWMASGQSMILWGHDTAGERADNTLATSSDAKVALTR